jgi:hypothetical protein
LPRRPACAFEFSQPLDAFIHSKPAGLVSCRIHSWDSALQSFFPLAQPFAVSDVSTLMALRQPSRPFPPQATNSRVTSHWASRPFQSGPHLQGLAPHKSPFLYIGGLDRCRHVALLSFLPSRVFASQASSGFHLSSPLKFLPESLKAPLRYFSGSVTQPTRPSHF